MQRLTFVYSLKNTFVARDLSYLSSLGIAVCEIQSPPFKTPPLFLWNRLREFFLGFWMVLKSKTVVVWFSDYHGFFPLFWAQLLGRKSILIVGGYDAVADKVNDHGIFVRANLRSKIALKNFRWATEIWPVDASLISGCPEALKLFHVSSGIAHFAPQAQKKCITVPTGYDTNYWKPIAKKEEQTLLTVGLFTDKRVAERKGISDFIALAQLNPRFKCTIIGEENNSICGNYALPENITVLPKSAREDLRTAYSKAKYYFQGSRVEGLPNVLCEAMLCECIPIGRKVFGIPNAIGAAGILYEKAEDLPKIARFMQQQHFNLGTTARQQILVNFNQEKRINAFEKALATQSKNANT